MYFIRYKLIQVIYNKDHHHHHFRNLLRILSQNNVFKIHSLHLHHLLHQTLNQLVIFIKTPSYILQKILFSNKLNIMLLKLLFKIYLILRFHNIIYYQIHGMEFTSLNGLEMVDSFQVFLVYISCFPDLI